MPANKRRVDAIDSTQDDRTSSRPGKVGRTQQAASSGNLSVGQRFGQDTTFVPFVPPSQADSIRFSQLEDDDHGAVDLVQSSQNADEINVSDSEFLGTLSIMASAMLLLLNNCQPTSTLKSSEYNIIEDMPPWANTLESRESLRIGMTLTLFVY